MTKRPTDDRLLAWVTLARDVARELLGLLGLGLVVWGVSEFSPAAGHIVAGLALIGGAVLLALKDRR